jgi:hypothetical protein
MIHKATNSGLQYRLSSEGAFFCLPTITGSRGFRSLDSWLTVIHSRPSGGLRTACLLQRHELPPCQRSRQQGGYKTQQTIQLAFFISGILD